MAAHVYAAIALNRIHHDLQHTVGQKLSDEFGLTLQRALRVIYRRSGAHIFPSAHIASRLNGIVALDLVPGHGRVGQDGAQNALQLCRRAEEVSVDVE